MSTNPDKSHHRPDGFQNNYIEMVPKPLAQVLRWRWDATRKGLPPAPATPTPSVAPELAYLKANATVPARGATDGPGALPTGCCQLTKPWKFLSVRAVQASDAP